MMKVRYVFDKSGPVKFEVRTKEKCIYKLVTESWILVKKDESSFLTGIHSFDREDLGEYMIYRKRYDFIEDDSALYIDMEIPEDSVCDVQLD